MLDGYCDGGLGNVKVGGDFGKIFLNYEVMIIVKFFNVYFYFFK